MAAKVAIFIFVLIFIAGLFWFMAREETGGREDLTVLAASSFAYVLREEKPVIEKNLAINLIIVEAASSTLARQIAEGAPGDLFITADKIWLNHLREKDLLKGEPLKVAGNSLVWATTAPDTLAVIEDKGPFVPGGQIVTGNPAYVPLGKYALEALLNTGYPPEIQGIIVPANDARDAVRTLESGAVLMGILFASDAQTSEKITILETIPEEAHEPIGYFLVVLKQSDNKATENFVNFLKSPAFRTILEARGFKTD